MTKIFNTCRIVRLMYDLGRFEYFSVISPTAPISFSHRAFNKICVKRILLPNYFVIQLNENNIFFSTKKTEFDVKNDFINNITSTLASIHLCQYKSVRVRV